MRSWPHGFPCRKSFPETYIRKRWIHNEETAAGKGEQRADLLWWNLEVRMSVFTMKMGKGGSLPARIERNRKEHVSITTVRWGRENSVSACCLTSMLNVSSALWPFCLSMPNRTESKPPSEASTWGLSKELLNLLAPSGHPRALSSFPKALNGKRIRFGITHQAYALLVSKVAFS